MDSDHGFFELSSFYESVRSNQLLPGNNDSTHLHGRATNSNPSSFHTEMSKLRHWRHVHIMLCPSELVQQAVALGRSDGLENKQGLQSSPIAAYHLRHRQHLHIKLCPSEQLQQIAPGHVDGFCGEQGPQTGFHQALLLIVPAQCLPMTNS